MSETTKDMTPEEKLLALIQQDKRRAESGSQTGSAVAPPAAPAAAPVPVPAAAPAKVAAVAPAPPVVAAAPVAAPPPAAVTPPARAVPKESEARLKLADPQPAKVVPKAPEAVPVPAPAGDAVGEPAPVSQAKEPSRGPAIPARAMSPRGFSLLLLNKILAGIVLVLAAFLFYRIGAIRPEINLSIERLITTAGTLPVRPTAAVQEKTVSADALLEKANARNAFVPRTQSKTPGAPHVEPNGSPKDFKLMAVSIDAAAEAESVAIIRNKTDSKTYYVKPGQTIGSTEYVLDRVYGDHVVVKLRKQEFDLK